MIRYRFILLTTRLTPLKTFTSSKEVTAYLHNSDHHCYIEVQAYDDMEPDHPRAWTHSTISRRRWFDHRHDMLFELIEAYGTKLDDLADAELHAKIRHADQIRFDTGYHIYLLYRTGELFHRQRDCHILQTAIASDFRKVASRHWKRLALQLFTD